MNKNQLIESEKQNMLDQCMPICESKGIDMSDVSHTFDVNESGGNIHIALTVMADGEVVSTASRKLQYLEG